MSYQETQSIATIVGAYVDERSRLTSRTVAPATSCRPTKTDVIRLYRRSARQLGHGQADQRFHLELLRLSKAADFDHGRKVMLAHSNKFLEARCGMSRTALGRQLRRHDGTTLRRSLSGNGHRFVARKASATGDGEVVEACGISLEPLIELMVSMQPMIAAQAELDLALAITKARIGRDRRRQRAAFDLFDQSQTDAARALLAQSTALAPAIRSAFAGGRLAEMETLSRTVAEIADILEQGMAVKEKLDGEGRTSEGVANGHLLPLQDPDSSEPVAAVGPALQSGLERDHNCEPYRPSAPMRKPPHWTPRSITVCLPSLEMYVGGAGGLEPITWRAVDSASSRLARDLGINAGCWQRALVEMGMEQRCIAIGLVAELLATRRINTTAGQYFGGMLKRARSGELHLDRSLWALRRKRQST